MTPQEAWGEHKLAVDHFRIFGCIHIPNEKKSKLDDKGVKCVFIGVSEESKGYKLYSPITQKAIISRDVLFDEDNTWDWNSKEKRSISVDLNEGDESRIDWQLQSHGDSLPDASADDQTENQPPNPEEPRPKKELAWMINYVNGDEMSDDDTIVYYALFT